jgi:hypothetical protein
MMNIAEMLFGSQLPSAVKAPKWLKGRAICPMMRGNDLWWECAPIMMVKGGPPSGVTFAHADAHRLSDDFGPVGRPTQVIAATKDIHDMLVFHDQLGEVRARCIFEHYKLAEAMNGGSLKWFVYPQSDDDNHNPGPLVGFQHFSEPSEDWDRRSEPTMVDRFEVFAFVSQAALSLSNFVSQETLDTLPAFSGVKVIHDHEDGNNE